MLESQRREPDQKPCASRSATAARCRRGGRRTSLCSFMEAIALDEVKTLDALFARRCALSPDKIAYQAYDRARKQWREWRWSDMAQQVARWQAALGQEGFQKGDRVAVLLRNGPEWVIWDQAVMSLGLVNVPLYTDDRPDNIAYILQNANIKALLVQDAGRWQRLAPAIQSSDLHRVILLDDSERAQKSVQQDERLRLAKDYLPQRADFQARAESDPHELASIVYTSGTTGRPKGVMLSHHNMLSVAYHSLKLLDCYEDDLFLSFLPLSHTLERSCGYYLPMMAGATVAYARSIAQLGSDLLTIKPSVLIAVPRIFERVYGKIQTQLAPSALKKGLFERTVSIGWQKFLYEQGRRSWSPAFLIYPLLDKLVAAPVRAKLGGRLRIAVSGGAALPAEIAKVFIGLGVPIVQGYGLTETSPVISANPLENNQPASVGIPLEGTEVKIGAQDELLVRGPGVMLGYWQNEEATRAVIDEDGWLHTGDRARIEGQHIYITGRLKDILVLSNGEKIPPGDMEMAISLDPLFEQVMVIGEGQSYLTALVVLNQEQWQALAQKNQWQDINAPEVHRLVLKRIKQALKDFPGYAKIRQVHLSLEPWTVDNGLLTPTLKIKRNKIIAQFADEIDKMYQN